MGWSIVLDGTKTKVTHSNGEFIDVPGGAVIRGDGVANIEVWQGGSLYWSGPFTAIDTIGGVARSGTYSGTRTQLAAVFPDASTGGAGGGFSAGTGTVLTGNWKQYNLTGNTAFTTDSTTRAGTTFLFVQDATGNRQPTLNGTDLPITLTANAWTAIMLLQDKDGNWIGFKDTTRFAINATPAPDVTAPEFQSATIEDADPSEMVLAYDEALDTGSVPDVADFSINRDSTPEAPDSVIGVSGTNVTLGLASPALNGEVFEVSYTPGTNKIQDAAGNEAVALVDEPVTNNVAAPSSGDPLALTSATTTFNNASDIWTVTGGANSYGHTGIDTTNVVPEGDDLLLTTRMLDEDTGNAVLGLHFANTELGYAAMAWALLISTATNELNYIDANVLAGTGHTLAVGDYIRIRKTGVDFFLETSSNGTSWTIRHSFGYAMPAGYDLWPVADFHGTTGKLDNPTIEIL